VFEVTSWLTQFPIHLGWEIETYSFLERLSAILPGSLESRRCTRHPSYKARKTLSWVIRFEPMPFRIDRAGRDRAPRSQRRCGMAGRAEGLCSDGPQGVPWAPDVAARPPFVLALAPSTQGPLRGILERLRAEHAA
jgi:hypothetical protein